jgi:hypothetical protein
MLVRFTGHRALISGLVVTLAVACFAPAQAQDDAEMKAMMAAATPGPHHAALAAKAGSYKTTSKMWMEPGQAPMETVGTSELKTVLDGRFVQEITKAQMMGMPWEGHGIYGYDNTTGKHTGIWYDSFGTMIMNFEGTCSDHCKTISLSSTYIDPTTRSEKVMKSVSQDKADGVSVTTLYDVVDGKDVKMVEITYEPMKQAKR